nr:Wadjet anti-phage system protein JetD domain-containing protein [Schaalia sp. Marseille-Q2122]
MKSPQDVNVAIQRQLRAAVASALLAPDEFIYEVPLGVPSEKKAGEHMAEVSAWVRQWHQASSQDEYEVEWVDRRWGIRGKQTLPARVRVQGAQACAQVSGMAREWASLTRSFEEACVLSDSLCSTQGLSARADYGAVAAAVASMKTRLSQLPSEQWRRVLAVVEWLARHPDSGMLIRSLPIAGMDTKWLGNHQGLVKTFLEAVREQCGLAGGSELGLHSGHDASFLTFWAEPAARWQGIDLLDIPVSRLSRIDIQSLGIRAVLICENKQSVLAMPEMLGALVIHGGGDRSRELARVTWLRSLPVFYWGDLDSHGFGILSRLRAAGLNMTSIMMDEETLRLFDDMAVSEAREAVHVLEECLTDSEVRTWKRLSGRRIEQERIAWDYVLERLSVAGFSLAL